MMKMKLTPNKKLTASLVAVTFDDDDDDYDDDNDNNNNNNNDDDDEDGIDASQKVVSKSSRSNICQGAELGCAKLRRRKDFLSSSSAFIKRLVHLGKIPKKISFSLPRVFFT